jgi:glycine cleavage system aminomethyltransferase T
VNVLNEAPLRRTALHDHHVAAGGKIVPFAGWEMPVQYTDGIRVEHQFLRSHAGIFDVSHMGQIEIGGATSGAWTSTADRSRFRTTTSTCPTSCATTDQIR